MKLFSNRQRPFHLGPFPAERLRRGSRAAPNAGPRPERPAQRQEAGGPAAAAAARYAALFAAHRAEAEILPPAECDFDPAHLARVIKASGHFLDAAMVGIAPLGPGDWYADAAVPAQDRAVVILVEHGRRPDPDSPAFAWTEGAAAPAARARALEIAVVLAGYIRRLGHAAVAHGADPASGDVAADGLAVAAGLALRRRGGNGEPVLDNPFLGGGFELAVVTTDLPLDCDLPLAAGQGRVSGLGYRLGLWGGEPGMERRRRLRRPSHLSRYPMERIRRTAQPTTAIDGPAVPRIPKRANFFERALQGDLGEKARAERGRFALKHPLAAAMGTLIRAMVPHQDGQTAEGGVDGLADPAANARAVKALSYFLGADLTGICEIPDYAWYSHHADGRPIAPYHRHAVVMLIDQGYETLEGASGDDWISGAQSMRAYMRGAAIAGQMAEILRGLGRSARPQTNADSDVLHIPLILHAGLGELSRIGELVLNPFVGPRFKSVVLTTDLPLECDRPVDFGLQDMCGKCNKCARECPCDAIAWGGKVMFNGYEMWKPDVERCTRYRLTNVKGSACGRCMKTCPYNHEGLLLHRAFLWAAIRLPFMRGPIARLDDRVGHGRINPAKTWWDDLELVDGRARRPRGSNRRELTPDRVLEPGKQKIAYYPAHAIPPGDQGATPFPVDRKAALAEAARMETPEAWRRRTGRD